MKRNATNALITIICGFYLLEMFYPGLKDTLSLLKDAPYYNGGAAHGVVAGEWYRIFTVALVHANWMHLAFNMWALFVLGTPIENAFGRNRFLAIFFISLTTGSLTSLVFMPANIPSVGASGALFGLFGALAVTGRKIGVDVRSILFLIGINLAIGFVLPGIDWHAHLGGLVGGTISALVLLRKRV